MDATTDVSVVKSLVVRYCKNDCLVNDRFHSLLQVKSGNAEDLASAISWLITSNDIPMKNFHGFRADDASIMMGKVSGVGCRLKELNRICLLWDVF